MTLFWNGQSSLLTNNYMEFRVLISKGMSTIIQSFKIYSKALQYQQENGGSIYLKVGSYGRN